MRNWGPWQFRVTFGYLMIALFIPFPVVALPQVKLMAAIGLANPFGVAILHILFNLAFNVLLFSAFIRGIPAELRRESARLDGLHDLADLPQDRTCRCSAADQRHRGHLRLPAVLE